MRRMMILKINSCYECPKYSVDKNTGKDQCYIKGFIKIKADKDGYMIVEDCPLRDAI